MRRGLRLVLILVSLLVFAPGLASARPLVGAAANGNPGAPPDKISQFDYVEQLVGQPLDVFRDYDPVGTVPLNSNEIYFAQHGKYLDVNWKPAAHWNEAGGGNATVNAEIDQAATSVRSVAPSTVFLTVWSEPENDVSGGTSCPTNPNASAGTPAQYRAMWANVEQRFAAAGVTNVVWAMDYAAPSNGTWDCLIQSLWPGNSLVDWVLYDPYDRASSDTWASTVGRFYGVLTSKTTATTNFASKPWGLGEFGTCGNTDDTASANFYRQGTAAVEANTYPDLKMYGVFDDVYGPQSGLSCLTNYDAAGQPDPNKQAAFNGLVSAIRASPPSAPGGCGVGAVCAPAATPATGAEALWGLHISPRTFKLTGRRVGGRCAKITRANRQHQSCIRPINLEISYRLTAPAQVMFTVTRLLPGRLSHVRCVQPTRKNRKHRGCTRRVPIRGARTVYGQTGSNTFTFTGRIGGHKLTPDRYQLTATPTVKGQPGTPGAITFTIAS
jgi:hypothetical protein